MDSLRHKPPAHLTPQRGTALQYAYRLLARRAYSEKELEQRLEGKGFTSKAVVQAVTRLKAQGYVNDASLACEQVEQLKRRGYGRRYIQHKLAHRGIAASLVDQTTQEVVSSEEELETARRLLQRRFGENGPRDRKARERGFRFLLSRGYSMDIAAALVTNREDPC